MKINRDKLKSFGGLLLHGSISCLAAGATGGAQPIIAGTAGILTSLVGGIAGSLAANHTAVLGNRVYDRLLDRLANTHPGDINHDLERLFRESAVVSLEFIKTLFLSEIKEDGQLDEFSKADRRTFLRNLEGFFDENIEDLRLVTKDNTDALDKQLLKDPTDFLDEIVAQVFRMSSYSFHETTEEKLRAFYATHLPHCFELAFKEALKNDDKGFKAFQVWVLEEMQAAQVQLLDGQKRIEEYIKAIDGGNNIISRDQLDTLLEEHEAQMYNLLSRHFNGIEESLERLSENIGRNFDRLYWVSEATYNVAVATKQTVEQTHDVAKQTRDGVDEVRKKLDELTPGRQFPLHLAQPLPPRPPVFLGREEDLLAVKKQLFENNHLLLLVNGDGGIGKTSLAAMYYHTYQNEYRHLAWVLKEQSIGDAMLQLADALQLSFDDNVPQGQRVNAVFARIAGLERPCLLVIDNANEQDDLEAWYPALMGCSNFHILLTTRITEFEQAERYTVEGLPERKALELFKKYYTRHKEEEDALFTAVWEATGRNTLIIELLAKNLQVLNANENLYTLEQLLEDLQSKGVLAIESGTVSTMYQGNGKFRKEKPEDIIMAMYDLGRLDEDEVRLLSAFAVLPSENIAYTYLKHILDETSQLLLMPLYSKGWLTKTIIGEITYYKISPVIQEVTRKKNEQLSETNRDLVEKLISLLDYEPGTGHFSNYKEAAVYTRYAESVFDMLRKPNHNLAVLAERIGTYYTATGNLVKALEYYEMYNKLEKELHESYWDNAHYKNGLAISYSKLGETYSSMGNLVKALEYYELQTELFEELHESYRDNVSFKHGLAISYEKLGDTYSSMGNLVKALEYYGRETKLFEELHESYRDNVSLKNGLAISYSRLGETYSSMGNLVKALEYYELYSKLEKELHESYRNNVSFKNSLSISYSKLGETYSSTGNLVKALEYYELYSKLKKELYELYRENVSFKHGLAISYSKLGDTYSSMGNLVKALEYYELSSKLEKELHESYWDNVSFKYGLQISYEKLGDTYSSMGNLVKALEYYEAENALLIALHESYRENVSFKNGLGISYSRLGETYSSMGNLVKALEYYELYGKLAKDLHELYSENVSFKHGLAISYQNLGNTYSSMGNLVKALKYYVLQTKLFEELHESYRDNVDFKNGLAISYTKLGLVHKETDLAKTRHYYELAKGHFEELSNKFPEYVQFSRNLNWVLKALDEL